MKVTKVEEMKVQMEALYQEIVRLQNTKSSSSKWVDAGPCDGVTWMQEIVKSLLKI